MSDDLTSPAIMVRDVSAGLNRYPGEVNGLATLGDDGTLTATQIPPSIANGMTFQATWNAATNTPTLPPVSTPDPGDFWIVTVAGSTALPGAPGPWTVGQIAVFNGTNWSAVPYYALAVGLPVAGASAGYVLYVDSGGLLQTAAVGSTSGIQGWSAALAAIATNGTPTAWGLARMLDSGQGANRTALALVPGTDVQAYSSVLTTLASNGAPGTEGLALLLADTAATARTTLGLGTLATQNGTFSGTFSGTSSGTNTGDQTISLTGDVTGSGTGSFATTLATVTVVKGGTGASTAAGARDNIVWSGAGAIDPGSPYTVAAGVDNVTFASSKTLAPRALSNYADGQIIRVTNSSASTITVTITPADGTIDGSSSVALTVLAHGVVGCQRVSASAWVSLQPGGLSYGSRLKLYVSGGTAYAQKQIATNAALTTWVDFGSPVAADSVTATLSGSTITVASGTSTATPSTAFYVAWKIDGTGGLALDWTAQGTVLGAQYTGMPSQTHGFAGVGWWTSTPGAGVLQFAGLQEEGATDQFIRTAGNSAWTNSGSLSSLVSVRMVNSIMSTSFQTALINGEYGSGSVFAATISSSTGSLSGLQVGFIVGRNGTTAGTATTTPVAYVSGGSVV